MSEIAEEYQHPCCRAGSNESATRLLQAAEVACLASGKRFTPLRHRVLATLARSRTPMGAYDLLHLLNKDNSLNKDNVSIPATHAFTHPLATTLAPAAVYRVLAFWESLGFTHRISSDKTWMACSGETHLSHTTSPTSSPRSRKAPTPSEGFLICRACGHAHEFSNPTLHTHALTIAAHHRFAYLSARVEIEGLCPSCTETTETTKTTK
ncbi:MAG: hypothetical protein OD811_00140 [Alphaproteobacteria bacterium]